MKRALILLVVGIVLWNWATGGSRPAPGDGGPRLSDDQAWTLSAVALGRSGVTGCGDFSVHRRGARHFDIHCGDGRRHDIAFPTALRTPHAILNGRRVDLN